MASSALQSLLEVASGKTFLYILLLPCAVLLRLGVEWAARRWHVWKEQRRLALIAEVLADEDSRSSMNGAGREAKKAKKKRREAALPASAEPSSVPSGIQARRSSLVVPTAGAPAAKTLHISSLMVISDVEEECATSDDADLLRLAAVQENDDVPVQGLYVQEAKGKPSSVSPGPIAEEGWNRVSTRQEELAAALKTRCDALQEICAKYENTIESLKHAVTSNAATMGSLQKSFAGSVQRATALEEQLQAARAQHQSTVAQLERVGERLSAVQSEKEALAAASKNAIEAIHAEHAVKEQRAERQIHLLGVEAEQLKLALADAHAKSRVSLERAQKDAGELVTLKEAAHQREASLAELLERKQAELDALKSKSAEELGRVHADMLATVEKTSSLGATLKAKEAELASAAAFEAAARTREAESAKHTASLEAAIALKEAELSKSRDGFEAALKLRDAELRSAKDTILTLETAAMSKDAMQAELTKSVASLEALVRDREAELSAATASLEAALKERDAKQAELVLKERDAKQAELVLKERDAKQAELALKERDAKQAEFVLKERDAKQAELALKEKNAKQADLAMAGSAPESLIKPDGPEASAGAVERTLSEDAASLREQLESSKQRTGHLEAELDKLRSESHALIRDREEWQAKAKQHLAALVASRKHQ